MSLMWFVSDQPFHDGEGDEEEDVVSVVLCGGVVLSCLHPEICMGEGGLDCGCCVYAIWAH